MKSNKDGHVKPRCLTLRNAALAAVLCYGAFVGTARAQELWPDLSRPAPTIGGGKADAAVIVGIEGYFVVPGVPGAKSNAKEWYDYFTETRGGSPQNVQLLTNENATRERILEAARKAAAKTSKGGTLWFVFVGHGAASADGKDGLLVGVDAQQAAESLQERSVKRGELLKVLGASQASAIRVVLDACFSGRAQDGTTIAPGLQPLVTVAAVGAIDPRMVVLTAAKGNQFAGALPGTSRPAFSYLVLGGLRGWAADGKKAAVTAGDLWRYATNALDATLRGRSQTPDLIGKEDAIVGVSAGERGPSLATLAKATAGGGTHEDMFKVSNLAQVPHAQAPPAMKDMGEGADFRNLDIKALKRYNEATVFDKSAAPAEEKAAKWRDLAKSAPSFIEKSTARAAQWDRYAAELAVAEEVRRKRAEARDKDWEKLSELLPLEVVPASDKTRWAAAFIQAYGRTPKDNPHIAELDNYLLSQANKPAIEWITIPGGSFMMGANDGPMTESAKPRHEVRVNTFKMAKTLVTFGQYKKCVDAGICEKPEYAHSPGDDHPVLMVKWEQAKIFSEWVGGRLPTEAEWEYAARSGGKNQEYPWGDEEPTCKRAIFNDERGGSGNATTDVNGCGKKSTWPVCSKPAGNTKQGLCDMAGNAAQWTQDWLHDSYIGAPSDGSAWESHKDDEAFRVIRGGSWQSIARLLRATSRDGAEYFLDHDMVGFRPVSH